MPIQSTLFACRDVTFATDPYTIVIVHVSSHELSRKSIQILTHLGTGYLGTGDSPMYFLHVCRQNNQLDFTFGDVGASDGVTTIQTKIEQEGILPFLKSCGASFQAVRHEQEVICSVASITYESEELLDKDGQHDIELKLREKISLLDHPKFASFLTLCRRQ